MSSWNTVLRDAWTVPTCHLNELTVKGGNVMRADSIQKTNKQTIFALCCRHYRPEGLSFITIQSFLRVKIRDSVLGIQIFVFIN